MTPRSPRSSAYHDRVYRYGRRVCRDEFDADDAVQEAFMRLARRPDVQRHSGALAWLYTTVKRACLRLMRPFRRERRALGERLALKDAAGDADVAPGALAASTEADATAQAALERWELVTRVHAAIAALDRPYREVIVLRDLEGLSGDEAARVLDIPLAAMKTRLHRARAQLRAALEAP